MRLSTKRLLLSLTLTLAASALASARQAGGLEVREGDMYVGPVRAVRVETAAYTRQQDGALVEGPRKLSVTHSYSEDGKRREVETYAADGTLRDRNVSVYDDAGRNVEDSLYSEGGRLIRKIISKPDEGETLYYYGDGTLRQRVVAVPRGDGTTEIRIYKSDGTLDKDYAVPRGRGDGTLFTPPVVKGGDGKTVTAYGPGVKEFESAVVKPDGTRLKTRERHERDEHGNMLKAFRYVWDAAAGDFVPTEVFYIAITYYR